MTSTSSVSKGVFVFKKKKSSPSKHRKKEFKAEWKNESWYQQYSQTWQSLEQQMEELYKEMFSKLLMNVTNYLKKEIKQDAPDIPTATILTGINIPDHAKLFSALENTLRQEVSPHVAVVSSCSCPRVRALLGNVLHQCQAANKNESIRMDEEDSDGEEMVQRRKKVQCTFGTLSQWYENQHQESATRPPLTVVLTDFESFNPQVLEDFIYIANEYRKQVPLVLVLGVATTDCAVHNALQHRVMSSLRMEVFMSQNSISLLHQLISKVILSPECHFKVGGKVFRMLTDNFLFYDFSVQSFLQKFKFCMLEHFSGRLKTVSSAVTKKQINNLHNGDLDIIRSLPSCREFIQSKPSSERSRLLMDDVYFKDVVQSHMEDFENHYLHFLVGLKCLHEMTSCLPGAPMGRNLGDLYVRAVSSKVWTSEDYTECKKLWQHLAKTQLESHLKNLIHILKDNDTNCERLAMWENKLRSGRKKLQRLNREDEGSPPCKTTCLLEMNPTMNRAQLKEQLKAMTQNSPSLNKFEKLREEILVMLEELLIVEKESTLCLLYPPGLLPFHELVMFDNLAAVKDQLIGNSRAALTNALLNPQAYIMCECCTLADIGEILPTLPDVSIAYKLHLESGKHINLYDWLQSFHCVINTTENGEQLQEIDISTQARFTQAVAELQFLGFVKSTTRKADHVMRLTWGTS